MNCKRTYVMVSDGESSVEDSCWIWNGPVNPNGYGNISVKQRHHLAHREVYMALVGPIPEGHELHHKCDNPPCCNPNHLAPVTRAEHNKITDPGAFHRRKTRCAKGHEYSPGNTYIARNGARQCRTCTRERMRQFRAGNLTGKEFLATLPSQ